MTLSQWDKNEALLCVSFSALCDNKETAGKMREKSPNLHLYPWHNIKISPINPGDLLLPFWQSCHFGCFTGCLSLCFLLQMLSRCDWLVYWEHLVPVLPVQSTPDLFKLMKEFCSLLRALCHPTLHSSSFTTHTHQHYDLPTDCHTSALFLSWSQDFLTHCSFHSFSLWRLCA